ncbi:SDR family NAD(P)-dependent oxidoreductase [Kushneria phosphatilytica]|uniref:SDR family NAD(P)-dependent oxidoreductase n=1 Tax=Kushneria phosphatilytica TaxID=657387 RepID=A0A1S1NSI7_9GAMM|nr:SDR family NAD(P)-dependent oxidoreductase [Kushneria phosphatilytica]OHV08984.1 3-oxoacyl-ACP reductase [Kushneria phosphatilytica]QEL12422.1 SDR family NAD(P)-dependent oxidoreductase [Kushneria phosphatilytica]
MSAATHHRTALIVGASRGLGHAMAAELLTRGTTPETRWNVIGTVRAGARQTPLHTLAETHPDRVEIETLDITEPTQIKALHERLAQRTLDLLFVNAGTTNREPNQVIGDVSTEEFNNVMLTNALSPMRVIETLEALVPASGLIGAMSSGQGSIANNEQGMRELYRGSKAALNMFMRSFAARQHPARAMVVMAPGWIRTELGGDEAPYTLAEAVPPLVDVLLNKIARPGLEYLDRFGETVPW